MIQQSFGPFCCCWYFATTGPCMDRRCITYLIWFNPIFLNTLQHCVHPFCTIYSCSTIVCVHNTLTPSMHRCIVRNDIWPRLDILTRLIQSLHPRQQCLCLYDCFGRIAASALRPCMNHGAVRRHIRLQFYDAIHVIMMLHVRQSSFCALGCLFVMIILVIVHSVIVAIGPRMKDAVVRHDIWLQIMHLTPIVLLPFHAT
mmetsp:Transcript_22513/g.34553  ORF Transcript_22513/g.34553 Transcript_22513/m.34553 type:complete len:200 (+) Transcript_22513:1320-1919(+)